MSLDQLRKRIHELREAGLLGSGYTAPELPGMGDPYQSQSSTNSSRNAVDNTEILGYTPVKTTGNNSAGMQTTNEYVPNMGAAPNADTAGLNKNTNRAR